MKGQICKVKQDKGFGFIRCRGGGADIFFHFKDLCEKGSSITIGSTVEFDLIDSEKGPPSFPGCLPRICHAFVMHDTVRGVNASTWTSVNVWF